METVQKGTNDRAQRPRRPAIPLVFYALVTLAASDRLLLASDGKRWLAIACISVGLALAATIMRLKRVPVAGTAFVTTIALVISLAQCQVVLAQGRTFAHAMESMPVSRFTLRVASDPSCNDRDTWRCRATASLGVDTWGDVWLCTSRRFVRGSTLRCVGRFSPNSDDDWGASSRMQGIWGTVRAMHVIESNSPQGALALLTSVRENIVSSLDADSRPTRALLAGCVCGWRDDLRDQGLDEQFSRAGLSHLIAVSGTHLAILMELLCTCLLALGLRPGMRACASIAVCALFVAFCGAPASAIRAWLMACGALLGHAMGRRSHGLSGVCVAGMAMLLLRPTVAGQLGFTLSVSSVVGLCLFSAYATYVMAVLTEWQTPIPSLPAVVRRTIRHASAVARESMGAAVVAQVATLPLVVEAFDKVSIVGPFASIVVTPLFCALMCVGLLAVVALPVPLLSDALLGCCDVLAWAILSVAQAFAELPFATVSLQGGGPWVGTVVCAFALMLLIAWPSVRRAPLVIVMSALALCLAGVAFRWRFAAPARVCVLDVGQGDAILVQDGSSAVLVDAGPDDSVVSALGRNHVMHLDALVITHLHDDHYAGAQALAGAVSCDRVLVAEGVAQQLPKELASMFDALTGNKPEELDYGDVLHVGGFALKVVSPIEKVDGADNEDSLMLAVTYEQQRHTLRALLTGDAEQEQTKDVLMRKDVGDIDLLKVGHHGSEASISLEQALVLRPEVAVASAGEDNAYGHPTAACVKVLEEAGSVFICTKDVGDVEVLPDTDGVRVRTQRP